VLLDEYGEVFLSDLGIVLPAETLTGSSLVGTPAYMSPEEVRGDRVDARTDVYQLGVVLFEMLTGQRPYRADTPAKVMMAHILENAPSLQDVNPNLLPRYNQVIQKALAKDPADRYASAGEMAAAFSNLVEATSKAVLVEPVANPFVVGNPVKGSLFVGRAEIFSRLQELWGQEAARGVNSVVLFGHRRMGKTSILQNLNQTLGEDTLVANFTMQRAGRVHSTGELLSYLALAIFDTLADAGFGTLPEPEPADYEPNGYPAFNRFLRQVRQNIFQTSSSTQPVKKGGIFSRIFGGKDQISAAAINTRPKRLILTIDEFELIEDAIGDGRVDTEFLDFLRGVIHSEPWLILALAGLHTLEEMTADYWNPLYASVTPVRVTFFTRTATGNLLAKPRDDFPLEFTNAAADRIFELVQGQPYLTQLIAHSLVSNFNQAIVENGQAPSPRFSAKDVDSIVDSAEFFEHGSYYFTGVWGQAEKTHPAGQTKILTALAREDKEVSAPELYASAGLVLEEGGACLETLMQHDVITKKRSGGGMSLGIITPPREMYDFAVPLMRRWIRDVKL